jgi:predicted secreted protein
MLLKKTVLVTSPAMMAAILLICVSGVWAGDSASFVDLGFSPDGRTYMFGQYGVQSPSLKPWAEIFVVYVRSNEFVQNGRASYTQDSQIRAGQDGSGVFYRLLNGNSNLANQHGINYQNQGLPLYISRADILPANGESIDFRDFTAEKAYRAELVSSVSGSGQNTKSSFFIKLEARSQNGQIKNYTVGSPGIVRPLIVSYNIKKVLIDARGESLIFVIEMKRFAGDGYDFRYMVEALRL